MNDTSAQPASPTNPGAHQPLTPYSEQLEGFTDALECLYIRNNPGGRRLFAENWPAASAWIFDPQLSAFDREGVSTDEEKARRRELEKQAEEKRLALVDLMENIKKRSVHDGLLQIDFVASFIKTYGRDLAAYVYADHLLEKFLPAKGSAQEGLTDEDLAVAQDEEQGSGAAEKKPAADDEKYLSEADRAEILRSLGPKLPDAAPVEAPKEQAKERKYNRKNVRDPNYRPPVIGGSSPNKTD